MGYFILYVIGVIITIVIEAYVSVKYIRDYEDEGFIPILVVITVFWPITLPAGSIAFGIYKLWNSSTKYFKKVINKNVKG